MTSCETRAFDPWSATKLEALQRNTECGARDLGTPHAPLNRWNAARRVSAVQASCGAENGGCMVLACMALCIEHDLTLPHWLRAEFVRRHQRVVNAELRTWDEAFGKPWPARSRLPNTKRRMVLKPVVYEAVRVAVEVPNARAIDRILFGEIGAQMGVGLSAAVVERLYAECLADGQPSLARLRPRAGRKRSPGPPANTGLRRAE